MNSFHSLQIEQPKVIKKNYFGFVLNCFSIRIKGIDYDTCKEQRQGSKFWGNQKKGIYGKGLCATELDPFKPARMGLIGEVAFGKIFNLPVNVGYEEKGDKYDFLIGPKSINVKLAGSDSGVGLIRHSNQNNKIMPLKQDIYVFGILEKEEIDEYADVLLLGYILKQDIFSMSSVQKARIGLHFNYEVPYFKLKSISHLLYIKDTFF